MRDLFLSSEDTRTFLYEYGATWGNARIRRKFKIEASTVDSLVAEGRVPPPQHVELDAESAEDIVIEGGLATISKHFPSFYVEPNAARHCFESGVRYFGRILSLLATR